MTTPQEFAPPPPAAADPTEKYDVAVLGCHLGSCLLAAALAAGGVRVLLVDGADDTSQAVGETTVPYTAEVFFTLARRFGLPEIEGLGLTSELPEAIRRTSGIKRSLSFLYHLPGREQDPRHVTQFNVPGEHSEWHPYRADVDQYTWDIAVRHGARVIANRPVVADVKLTSDEATVRTSDGAAYRARYIVDALGPGSPLVRGLASTAGAGGAVLTHSSRVIAAHMRGVLEFERCVELERYARATPWSLGTISHLFPGGWLQVVHFGNHADAANRLSSVTLSVDPDRYADLPDAPEAAFRDVVDRFPSLRRAFVSARPAGPWTNEPRWQFAAPVTVLDRAFAFERSASRNDMFLSRDVTMSAELALALAPVLIEAVRTDDWSAERFVPVARFQAALTEFNDRILAAARTATRDFALWNAYSRLWLLWSILAALSLKRLRAEALRTGEWAPVSRLTEGPYWFALPAGLPELLDEVFTLLADVERDAVLPRAAATRIFALLDEAPFAPPLYGFGDPKDRYYHFTAAKRLRMLLWSKTTAPAEFRTMLTRENVTSRR